MTPLCCVGTVGVGWGGSSLGGVNISNASHTYVQPDRVISGSCNYLPGYHPSDPTSNKYGCHPLNSEETTMKTRSNANFEIRL